MSDEEEDFVTVRLPRSAFVSNAPRPATVTQRSCMEHFGISKRDFLRMAGRRFPVSKIGHLRIARYSDVEAALMHDATMKKRKTQIAAMSIEDQERIALGLKPRGTPNTFYDRLGRVALAPTVEDPDAPIPFPPPGYRPRKRVPS